MTPTTFKGIVVLDTQAQFEELSTTGTLVIGTETITYQPTSYLYYVKEGGSGGGSTPIYKHDVRMTSSSDLQSFDFMFYSSSDVSYDNLDDFLENNIGLKLYLSGFESSPGGDFPIQSLEVISGSQGTYMSIAFWDSFMAAPPDKRIDSGSGWADSFSEDVIEC